MTKVSHKTVIYSLLACALMITMTACQKCGGSKDVGKDGYIMRLDALCTQSKAKADSMYNEYKTANEKGDSETANAIAGRMEALYSALMQEMKKVAQPSEDAATLKEFWTESDKFEEISGRFVTQMMKYDDMKYDEIIAAAKNAPESEPAEKPNEGEEEDAPKDPFASREAASAELDRIDSEREAQRNKFASVAKKYGFKVCGLFSGQK